MPVTTRAARKLFGHCAGTSTAVASLANELLFAVLDNLKARAKALGDDDAYLEACLEMSALDGVADGRAMEAHEAAMAAMNVSRDGARTHSPTISCENNLGNSSL